MKIYNRIKYFISGVVAICILFLTALSCRNDDETIAGASPIIESVNEVVNDTPVTSGIRGNMYIIHGNGLDTATEVYFNGIKAYFNNALSTYKTLFVTIPMETSYSLALEKQELKIVTKSGTAIYKFRIEQPAPAITNFSPVAGSAGTEVTIKGNVLVNPTSVKFGNIDATIVSSTETEIKVIVPSGLSGSSEISVSTSGGSSISAPAKFGFTNIIYDDSLATGWSVGGWSGTNTVNSSQVVSRGVYSIKRETDGWGGFSVGNNTSINISNSTGIKFSIYSQNGGTVKVFLNGDFGVGQSITLPSQTWTNVTIPLSVYGNPVTLSQIALQEFNGASNTYYIDDIGSL